MVGLTLATQQATVVDQFAWRGGLNLPLSHQVEEPHLILRPRTAALFVIVEHVFRGCEVRQVDVRNAADSAEEILKVVALRETGELRHVVESHIEYSPRSRCLDQFKELASRLLREADCVHIHETARSLSAA